MNNEETESYMFNFTQSYDLNELRAKILKLKVVGQNGCDKEEMAVIEEKSQHFTKRLQESDEHLLSLTNKLRILTGNYAAFSSVLELKQELGCQVEKCKEENAKIIEKHNEELEKLKKDLQETKDTWANILALSHEEHKKQIEDLENSWKEKLTSEETESGSLRKNLQKLKDDYTSNLDKLKRKHHNELENLRIQIELLKRASSSNSIEVYAQKFFEAQAEFEKNLLEKDNTINDLNCKLKEAEDNIRHLKLLSVIRNAQTAPHTTQKSLRAPPTPQKATPISQKITPTTQKAPPTAQKSTPTAHKATPTAQKTQSTTCPRSVKKHHSLNFSRENEQFVDDSEACYYDSDREAFSTGVRNVDQNKKGFKKRKLFTKESSFLSDTPE